jgi:hypothetical protein
MRIKKGSSTATSNPPMMSLTALLAHMHLGFHEFDQAAMLASDARRGREKTLGIRIKAGALRLAQHRNVEAEELLRAAYLQAIQCWPESGYQYYLMSLRGESLVRRAEYAAAEPLLLQAHQGLERHRGTMLPYLNPSRRIEESTERLARLYEAWDKPAQASRWNQQPTAQR